MKQIFKYILIGLSLLAVPKVAGAQAVNREGGVATIKTVGAQDSDGNYTIKLETWAEGETAVVETATPVDVVLVLDVSGSMAWPKGDYSQSTKTSYSYNDIVKGEVEYFRRYNPQSDYIEKIYGEEVVVGGQTRYYLYISPDDGTGNNQGTYLQSNGATTTGRSNAAYATSPTATIVTPSGSEGYGWGATQRTDLFYQGKSRIVALQEAVCAFIDKIEENDLKDKQGEPRAERLHNKIAIVKFAGARHVVVTDFNQYRLDMAKKLGATRTINLNEEKLEEVMEKIGMQEGFDVGLEMSGSPAALNSMIHNMKHGGNIALLGLQETDTVVDLETVIFNGLNIKGIYGRKVWDTWYKMTTMLQAGLKIDDIITHHFDARDYEKGFQAMISGQSGKVILDWTHINEEKPE